MEIDVNIEAHDLIWRRMDLARKQDYVKSWGVLKDKIIEEEVARLIEAGFAIQYGSDLELTSEGKVLYKRMTTRCPKTD